MVQELLAQTALKALPVQMAPKVVLDMIANAVDGFLLKIVLLPREVSKEAGVPTEGKAVMVPKEVPEERLKFMFNNLIPALR
jgi:hypothetical protein